MIPAVILNALSAALDTLVVSASIIVVAGTAGFVVFTVHALRNPKP